MKKFLITLFVISLVVISSCEEKVNVEEEKVAIKSVIENESNFNLLRDFAKQSESFLQDETMFFLGASADYYWSYTGWDEIYAGYQSYHEGEPQPHEGSLAYSNYKIKVYENSAFAVYDEIAHDQEGKFLRKNISVRFLEKVKGEWKIVYLGFVNGTSYEN